MDKKELVIESIKGFKNGFAFALIFSIVIPLILWIWKPDSKIPFWIFIFTLIALLVIISLMFTAIELMYRLYQTERTKNMILPKVVSVKSEESSVKLFLSDSRIFSQGTLNSLYFLDEDESETFLGVGLVDNIQMNGIIQFEIKYWEEPHEIIDEIKNNNKYILGKLIIKPNVPISLFEKLMKGEEL